MSSSHLPPPSDSAADDESSGRLARWKAKWDERSLGWHEDNVHEALVRYGHLIIPGWSMKGVQPSKNEDPSIPGNVCEAATPDSSSTKTTVTCGAEGSGGGVRVFFPLCGKTLDMAAAAAHPLVAEVVGVDGIRTALDEFAQEHPELNVREEDKLSDLPASDNQANDDDDDDARPRYDRLVGNKILLLKGDFFGLDESATSGRFDAVFDRASLVAIDPQLRTDYVQVMKNVVRPGGKVLLVVIERVSGNDEEDRTAGPPFTVPEAHVRALYETQDWVKSVTLLEEKEPEGDRKMRSVYYLVETVGV